MFIAWYEADQIRNFFYGFTVRFLEVDNINTIFLCNARHRILLWAGKGFHRWVGVRRSRCQPLSWWLVLKRTLACRDWVWNSSDDRGLEIYWRWDRDDRIQVVALFNKCRHRVALRVGSNIINKKMFCRMSRCWTFYWYQNHEMIWRSCVRNQSKPRLGRLEVKIGLLKKLLFCLFYYYLFYQWLSAKLLRSFSSLNMFNLFISLCAQMIIYSYLVFILHFLLSLCTVFFYTPPPPTGSNMFNPGIIPILTFL